MKFDLKTIIILLLFNFIISCNKKHTFFFNDKEIEFLSYTPDQKEIKFIDTTGIVNTLVQTGYSRDLLVVGGLFRPNDYYENYNVYYNSKDGRGLLYVSENANYSEFVGSVFQIDFFFVDGTFNPDSLHQEPSPLIINNKTYTNVYKLKMFLDSTFLYYNKQYGIIQMIYKNGKTITRTD